MCVRQRVSKSLLCVCHETARRKPVCAGVARALLPASTLQAAAVEQSLSFAVYSYSITQQAQKEEHTLQ